MVTIRISDRHRLIQPYIHNYSWLLFAALALYTSELNSERQIDGESLDLNILSQASALQTYCSQLITDCLLKGQTGKGKFIPKCSNARGGICFLCHLIFNKLCILSPHFSIFKITQVSHAVSDSANLYLSIFCPFCAVLHIGLRSSALLALLSSNESASDSEICPVSPESSQELSTATDTSSLPGSTAAICSPSSPKDKVRNRIHVVK